MSNLETATDPPPGTCVLASHACHRRRKLLLFGVGLLAVLAVAGLLGCAVKSMRDATDRAS
jgi:hypothetical protein